MVIITSLARNSHVWALLHFVDVAKTQRLQGDLQHPRDYTLNTSESQKETPLAGGVSADKVWAGGVDLQPEVVH
jgi:hypothetical protein